MEALCKTAGNWGENISYRMTHTQKSIVQSYNEILHTSEQEQSRATYINIDE